MCVQNKHLGVYFINFARICLLLYEPLIVLNLFFAKNGIFVYIIVCYHGNTHLPKLGYL